MGNLNQAELEYSRASELAPPERLKAKAEELRKRNRITSGREQTELTQKQLATFRRDNVEIETLLRKPRHDRETKAALTVLEGGKKSPTEPLQEEASGEKAPPASENAPKKNNPYENLLVLKRIEL